MRLGNYSLALDMDTLYRPTHYPFVFVPRQHVPAVELDSHIWTQPLVKDWREPPQRLLGVLLSLTQRHCNADLSTELEVALHTKLIITLLSI